MKVEQINVGNALKNFVYILHDESSKKAWVIDPFDAKQVENFIDSNNYTLEMVINTHLHPDHVRGNKSLIEKYQAKLWDLDDPQDIHLTGAWSLKVRKTPGHTPEHVVFALMSDYEQVGFFGGDTIFHNGIGHCKLGGDPEVLYETIQDLKYWVSPKALFYTGHDYGVSNLKFSIDQNPSGDYQEELDRLENTSTRVFGFDRELRTNIFLNVEREQFLELRKQRDNW